MHGSSGDRYAENKRTYVRIISLNPSKIKGVERCNIPPKTASYRRYRLLRTMRIWWLSHLLFNSYYTVHTLLLCERGGRGNSSPTCRR